MSEETQEMWATVELMGHGRTAGKISRPADFGGLLRVDVPLDDGNFRSEFYGMAAIYAIKVCSEEIARAYSQPYEGVYSYDTPIVTREQHEHAVRQLENQNHRLRHEMRELERRLTAVNALPAGNPDIDEDEGPFYDDLGW